MRRKLVILGTAGSSVDILDLVEDMNARSHDVHYECAGFLDDNAARQGTRIRGIAVLGPLSAARGLTDCLFVNGIGSPNNHYRKEAILANTGIAGDRFITLVHPSAVVSKTATIGRGTVVFPSVTIGSNAAIGSHVIILANSVINHDVSVGDYACIASGVCIAGGSAVGRAAYLGSNCSIIENTSIGSCSLVGMGSVVIDAVADNSVVVGNPARFLRPSGAAADAVSRDAGHYVK